MKTICFKGTIGVTPGYNHDNNPDWTLEDVARAWDNIASKKAKDFGRYITCCISHGKVVYDTGWGCPPGGENVLVITGEYNPVYNPPQLVHDDNVFKVHVALIFKDLSKVMQLSTCQITFSEQEFVYIDNRKIGAS